MIEKDPPTEPLPSTPTLISCFPRWPPPHIADPNWEPAFADYLYVSFTNATAFSPTDTMPLTRWAKMIMLLQSAVSLITVALVVARAVNILK